MKTITTDSQAFLAFAFMNGVRLAGIQISPEGFCVYEMDNSTGIAEQALERWKNNDVLVNAKKYNRAFHEVTRVTAECRKTAAKQLRRVTSDNKQPMNGESNNDSSTTV